MQNFPRGSRRSPDVQGVQWGQTVCSLKTLGAVQDVRVSLKMCPPALWGSPGAAGTVALEVGRQSLVRVCWCGSWACSRTPGPKGMKTPEPRARWGGEIFSLLSFTLSFSCNICIHSVRLLWIIIICCYK